VCRRHRSKDKLNYATAKDVPIKSYVEEYVLNTYDVSTAFGSGFKEATAPLNLHSMKEALVFLARLLSLKKL